MCLASPPVEWDDLPGLFPGFARPGRWLPLLRRHHELLLAAAEHTRVSSVPVEDAIQRHYAESLEILRIALHGPGRMPGSIVDVGSGGGFPGIVFACLMPEAEVALIEPLTKRARLLTVMAEELGLANVSVQGVRAEEAGRSPLRDACELVTARAVAPLAELLEYTAPLAAMAGSIVLPKGSAFEEELAASRFACEALQCRFVGAEPMRTAISETLSVASFAKTSATPAQYPRRPGIPGKRPL